MERSWLLPFRTTPILVLFFALLPGRSFGHPPTHPISTYNIDVQLNTSAKELAGREIISWTNVSEVPVTELWFHLYWNAFRNNKTTLLSEALRTNSRLVTGWKEDDWGCCEITALRLIKDSVFDDTNLLKTIQYRSPDDQNPNDETVFSVVLPRTLEPGHTVGLEIDFRSKIPRPIYNAGVFRDFYFICQWFPKLGVFIDGGWNCHQHHYSSEYFSEYSAYDVTINAPASYVLGATGKRVSRIPQPDGTVSHRFQQENVHDFAWTACPLFIEHRESYEFAPGKTTEIILLLQPFHSRLKDRYLNAVKKALDFCSSALFDYPYATITCVDPVRNGRCSGMEYPTLFTGGAYFISPRASKRPQDVTIHEFVHNYFYGILGTNEFEDAWMDEGMTSFYDSEIYISGYGEPLFTKSYFGIPFTFKEVKIPIESEGMIYYVQAPEEDNLQRRSWEYRDSKSYTANVYGKGELLFRTVQRLMGGTRFSEMMKAYARGWSYRHPKPEDFIQVLESYAPQEITTLVRTVLSTSDKMDYSIDEIRNRRIPSFQGRKKPAEDSAQEIYESEVTVGRHGALSFRVDILVVFENGEKITKSWDGRYRWQRLSFKGNSRIVSAIVDPDFKLVLDVNRANNSRIISPHRLGPLKWTSRWLFWLQHALELLTMFAS